MIKGLGQREGFELRIKCLLSGPDECDDIDVAARIEKVADIASTAAAATRRRIATDLYRGHGRDGRPPAISLSRSAANEFSNRFGLKMFALGVSKTRSNAAFGLPRVQRIDEKFLFPRQSASYPGEINVISF